MNDRGALFSLRSGLHVCLFMFFDSGFLCVALAGLKLGSPPVSASQAQGLKAPYNILHTSLLISFIHIKGSQGQGSGTLNTGSLWDSG